MLKILFFSVWFMFHPVHVTLTSIDYVSETVSFNVFIRMYYDDFLVDYRNGDGIVPKEGFTGKSQESVTLVEDYLNEKILLKVDKNQLVAKLIDLKISDNEINLNIIYNCSGKPKTVTVKNLIMTSLYSDQANMVIVKVNDFEEGVKLTSAVPEQTFNIK